MVLADLIGSVRTDYKILTRSLLTGVDEIDEFMMPVPFAHDEDAQEKNLEMRARAMEHLELGGAIVLFPSGVVASSDTMFGPVIEADWNPFTAKMIRRSGATVLPIYFSGPELALVSDRQQDFGHDPSGPADARGRARAEQTAKTDCRRADSARGYRRSGTAIRAALWPGCASIRWRWARPDRAYFYRVGTGTSPR